MKLFRTANGTYVEQDGSHYRLPGVTFDSLIVQDDLEAHLDSLVKRAERAAEADISEPQAPIGSQEVWAAGITYFRSRSARMEESKTAGGGSFYDRVYSARRPELFFKSTAGRVVGPHQPVRIRRDSSWSVPEPELTLVINPRGGIIGYTVGNDMSSRDIEGENPLYLPQAKVYNGSCALGPAILVAETPPAPSTAIGMEILRGSRVEFSGSTTLAELKRDPKELVSYLYRECGFAYGCFLMTGTGVIPPDTFTLHQGDEIRITIDGIGTLVNRVADGA